MYRQPADSSLPGRIAHVMQYAILVPFRRIRQQGGIGVVTWAFDRSRLLLTGVPTLRFARITDTLYVGGQIGPRGWRRLTAVGVTSIVNMRGERDDRASGIDVPVERYLHLPTVDDDPVDLEKLRHGADWIAGQIAAGGAVYVHCAAGSGRAPSMGAAYLIAHQGMSTDEALAAIRARRPFIMPMAEQVDRLREFESQVGKASQKADTSGS